MRISISELKLLPDVKSGKKKNNFPLPHPFPRRSLTEIPLYLMDFAFEISYNVKTNEARPRAAGTFNKGWS